MHVSQVSKSKFCSAALLHLLQSAAELCARPLLCACSELSAHYGPRGRLAFIYAPAHYGHVGVCLNYGRLAFIYAPAHYGQCGRLFELCICPLWAAWASRRTTMRLPIICSFELCVQPFLDLTCRALCAFRTMCLPIMCVVALCGTF